MTSDPVSDPYINTVSYPTAARRRSSSQSVEIYNPLTSKKSKKKTSESSGVRVETAFLCFEIGVIILFALFVVYDGDQASARPKNKTLQTTTSRNSLLNTNNYDSRGYGSYDNTNSYNSNNPPQNVLPKTEDVPEQTLHTFYFLYQDVHVMIFIGFGFLMNFLRKYGYSAIGLTMLVGVVAIQWSILCRGVFRHDEHGMIPLEITGLINADFAAGAVLISVGAVIGVTTPFQLLVLCLIEVFLYALNEYIGSEYFQAIDVGGSMYIHAFGAYFGLAMSRMLKSNKDINAKDEAATKTSDLFAMVGTVFLWLYWPSFNGALAAGDDQHRAILNTVLSLTASLMFTFIISGLLGPENKLNMVHIQNATLAGGVAVGAVADLMIKPFGALIIGTLAGSISTLGYVYITPFLQSKFNLHDTCGINNLHGMTGILGGLAGSLMAAIASEAEYGNSLYLQYPARAPLQNSSELSEIVNEFTGVKAGDNRTAGQQALYQLAALGLTLVIAIIGGSLTGLLLKAPIFGNVPNEQHFDDAFIWEIPEDEEKQKLMPDENVQGVTNRTFDFEMTVDKVVPGQEL